MADSVAQTRQIIDITLGDIHGDAIKHCIERLNNANQHNSDSVLRANMKAVTTSVSILYDIELADAIKELTERIRELDMQTYQNDMRFDRGGTLTLKPDVDFPKIDAFSDTPVEDSEKHLKKLIKHAKTPMERKMYEKKLNALYKKRKGRYNG